MKKFWNGLKNRYFIGIKWMKIDQGMPSMMYWTTTIAVLLIHCVASPENAMQFAKTVGMNLVLIYLYSGMMYNFDFVQKFRRRLLHRIGFVCIELFVLVVFGMHLMGLNFWHLLFELVIPIAVAFIMIPITKNCALFEDFIVANKINNSGIVLLTTIIPVSMILFALFLLEWSIYIKAAIPAAFMLIAPLVCWADFNNYGIFGAIGVEW